MKKSRLKELYIILVNNGYITENKKVYNNIGNLMMTLTDDEFTYLINEGLISHNKNE